MANGGNGDNNPTSGYYGGAGGGGGGGNISIIANTINNNGDVTAVGGQKGIASSWRGKPGADGENGTILIKQLGAL